MKNPNFSLSGTPPKLFPTLLKGFNTIANHWYLILFPIFLDVFLWLGPKIRLKTLLTPVVDLMSSNMTKITPPEMIETVKASQSIWDQLLNQFNLITTLRTFPVGVPSIIARQSPILSPLGEKWVFEMTSTRWVFTAIGLLLLIGFLLGSLYFLLISRVTATENEKLTVKQVFSSYAQSLVMFCLMLTVLLLISVPLLMLLSVLSLINFSIGQFFILVAVFLLLWLMLPLVFAPHGVFVLKQKALPSMLISIRLVRLFLPGTGLFVIISLLINEGMNMLWTLPEPTSWLTLVGIGGHSFIITGILAASFVYYREGLHWMQENLQRMAESARKQQEENGGTSLEQQ